MKKAKLLSLLLAAVMLLSLIPAVGLTATAATATATAPALPPALPTDDIYKAGHTSTTGYVYNTVDGKINPNLGLLSESETTPLIPEDLQGIQYDVYSTIAWDDNIAPIVTKDGSTSDTYAVVAKDQGTLTFPQNATGFLIHYENTSTDAVNDNCGIAFRFIIDGKKYHNTNSTESGDTTPFHVYYYDAANSAWRVNSSKDGLTHCSRLPGAFNGYIYIPLESLDLNSAAVAGKTLTEVGFGSPTWTSNDKIFHSVSIVGKKATGTNYKVTWKTVNSQITELYAENATPVSPYNDTALEAVDATHIYTSFKSWDQTPTAVTANVTYTATWNKIVKIMPEVLPDPRVEDASNDLDGIWKAGHKQISGVDNFIYNKDGAIDETLGRLESTSTQATPESTWGKAFALINVCSGYREISSSGTVLSNTTAVAVPTGTTGLMLRIRNTATGGNNGHCVRPSFSATSDGTTYIGSGNTGTPGQYIYYYDGELGIWRATEAQWNFRLPPNFTGYVYIPIGAYYVDGTNPLEQMTPEKISGQYLRGITASYAWNATKLVVESVDFVIPMDISKVSITVNNALNLNVYANCDATATLNVTPVNTELADKAQTGITGTKQADGTYKFTYKNILPQLMGEKFKVELVSGGKVVDSGEFSVREYCETLLNDANSAADLKALVVDILKYGAAAQNYADYNTTDLATKNLNTTQLALGAAVSNKVGTDATLTPATAATQFTSATLRLQDAVALRLNITSAEAAANVSVTVTLGSKSQTYTGATLTATDGGYTVLFTNISATEYAETITATVSVNGTLTQTLTYSVNTYLANVNATAGSELGALVDAIYAYGVSASAYAGN